MGAKRIIIDAFGLPNITKQEFYDAVDLHLQNFSKQIPEDSITSQAISSGLPWDHIYQIARQESSNCAGSAKVAKYLSTIFPTRDKYFTRHLKLIKG
jgi:hypothetical protein